MTFGTVVVAGSKKLGVVGFWKAQVPHMELPFVLAILLKPMIFAIEIVGLLIKHFVLSVRLLANMFAGHLVLGVLVAFVAVVGTQVSSYWQSVVFGSQRGQHLGVGRPESAGAICGLSTGLHFHLFVGIVHRDGCSSALAGVQHPDFPDTLDAGDGKSV